MQTFSRDGKGRAHAGAEAITEATEEATAEAAAGIRDDGSTTKEGPVADLVADNDLQLAELSCFLSAMAPAVYAQSNGENAAIGQHVRHILDHYECLLGAPDGRVDYTRRAREEIIGSCPEAAISRIDATRQRIARLREITGDPVESKGEGLRMEVIFTPARTDREPVQRRLMSTLERELMFVLSHTIHHMALIAVLVRREGTVPIPSGFGVAPSTMRYADPRRPPACAQ